MTKSQKALAKQKAKRAQHNKELRLKRDQEAVERRRTNKQITTANEFSKQFVADCLSIVTKRVQFIADIKAVVKRIEILRASDPAKYQNLSTDKFNAVLTKLEGTEADFVKLADLAAQMETTTDLRERMKVVMENIDALVNAQSALAEMVAEMVDADNDFKKSAETPEAVKTNTLDTPDVVEYEGRSMEDGEIDVPADAKLES